MMLSFTPVVVLVTALLCALYVALIAGYCYGWIKTKTSVASSGNPVPVAVIIAARNEEQNIGKCLEAVLTQNYPATQFRIYVVNDHSTDRTAAIVSDYAERYAHVQLIDLPQHLSGKKNAIATAIAETDAELIVTTDADCSMDKSWLQSIVSFYSQTNAQMIVGPVAFCDTHSLFEKMQSLELMALMGSTAGSLHFNNAILCNGANLAYPRKAYEAVNGFKNIDASASGDDVLLMYKISGQFPGSVKFLMSRDAVVQTPAKATIQEFINQRKRWASKGFKVLNTATKTVSLLVYFFSFFLLFSTVLAAVATAKSDAYQPFLNICLILAGIKCIIDFLLLFLAASFFKKRSYLFLFLPEQLLYIFYVVVVGLLGAMKKYEWKGRNY